MATSSCSQTAASPKELLLVLSILNEKQKRQKGQQLEQEEQHQQQHHYQQHYRHQQIDQQQQRKQQEQQQLEEIERECEQKEPRQHMELSQIELIYRAEGNANLVLALPQFKKVLRLPKISKQHEQKHLEQQPQRQEFQRYQKNSQQQEGQPKQQDEMNQQESNKIPTTGQQENKSDANRLDKEFGGHFGLLLPDATQLPAEFDILFSNLQSSTTATIATETSHCSNSKSSTDSSTDNSWSISNNIFGSDTFAIEIKPKQGWLLPNDVNNLFDIKPKITQTTRITQPPSLRETKKALKAAVATTMPTETETKALKTSTDIQCFTTTQNEPSQTIVTAAAAAAPTAPTATTSSTTALTTKEAARAPTSRAEVPTTTSRWSCSDRMSKTGDDKISHSLCEKVDTRCRYCCMQFLKIKQQKVCTRSQYCPIDLFSGITENMHHALQALFECPQNNLRIFQNGSLVFDDLKSRTMKIEELFSSDKLQLIKHLLVTCLLREYEHKGEAKNEEEEEEQKDKDNKQQPLSSKIGGVRSDGHDASAAAVAGAGVGGGAGAGVAVGQPQSSVSSSKKQKCSTMPKTIRTTTTSLTETEVTKVKSTLTPAKPIFSMDNASASTSTFDYNTRCLEQINKAEVTCLPKNCVLQKILYLQLLAKINLQFMLDHEYADNREKTYNIVCKLLGKFAEAHRELTLCQLSPEEQYILAATALDCSIMITFCEIENVLEDKTQKAAESPFVVSVFERRFLTKVTLLDLDPKPDAHFHKYFQQTQQIVDAMEEM